MTTWNDPPGKGQKIGVELVFQVDSAAVHTLHITKLHPTHSDTANLPEQLTTFQTSGPSLPAQTIAPFMPSPTPNKVKNPLFPSNQIEFKKSNGRVLQHCMQKANLASKLKHVLWIIQQNNLFPVKANKTKTPKGADHINQRAFEGFHFPVRFMQICRLNGVSSYSQTTSLIKIYACTQTRLSRLAQAIVDTIMRKGCGTGYGIINSIVV